MNKALAELASHTFDPKVQAFLVKLLNDNDTEVIAAHAEMAAIDAKNNSTGIQSLIELIVDSAGNWISKTVPDNNDIVDNTGAVITELKQQRKRPVTFQK